MNNIDKNFSKKTSMSGFAKKYFSYLNKVLERIDDEDLDKLEKVLDDVRLKENTIFVAGNGGSAATAITMANDIGFDILKKTSSLKKKNKQIIVNLAINYGSKNEILKSIKKSKQLNIKTVSNNLYTGKLPNPDILIRTGGQQRLSNFMLWQLAYTELFFLKKLWPDFNSRDLHKIIKKYKFDLKDFFQLQETGI